MPYIVKQPEGQLEKIGTGLKQAVCSHMVDIGVQSTPWGDTPKVVLVFETKQCMTHGDYAGAPFMFAMEYNGTLAERSNLRKDLVSWRGKEFSAEELKGFDLERLVGANCMLEIIEKPKKDGTGSREVIGHISKKPKELPDITPSGSPPPSWVIDKANQGKAAADPALQEATQTTPPEDELPF